MKSNGRDLKMKIGEKNEVSKKKREEDEEETMTSLFPYWIHCPSTE